MENSHESLTELISRLEHEAGAAKTIQERCDGLESACRHYREKLAAAEEENGRLREALAAELESSNLLADSIRDGDPPSHVTAAVEAYDAREWDIIHSQPMPDWLIALRDAAVDEARRPRIPQQPRRGRE